MWERFSFYGMQALLVLYLSNYLFMPENIATGQEKIQIARFLAKYAGSEVETLLSAAAVDRMHDGPRTKYDRELGAQGVGNLICGALGALPMTGVIVRSAANVQAGATTRASTILHGTWMLGFVMLLPWLLRMTPIAGLAGVLIFTGVKMVNPSQIKEFAAYGRGSLLVFLATALVIVATDLLTGVLAGMALSILRLALRAAMLHVNLRQLDKPNQWELRLEGSATFLSVPRLAKALDAVPEGATLHLDVDRLRFIDHACLVLLKDWQRTAPATNRRMVVDPAAIAAELRRATTPAIALGATALLAVMPGVLVIEALAQAGGLLSQLSRMAERPADAPVGRDPDELYYLVKVDNAKFSKMVVPGDRLEGHIDGLTALVVEIVR